MTPEQQNLAWACLPKEVRLGIVQLYVEFQAESKGDYCNRPFWIGIIRKFESIFGQHNLTSDTEPEEMLMVERKDVQWRYARNIIVLANNPKNELSLHIKALLESLFGDKCLPDEEPSVQGEPKFNVGDKVRVLENAILADNRGKIATIIKRGQCCKGYGWVLDISKSVFLESELEPYTEPETKDNMEEKELNLPELLKGCEGEWFYVTPCGEMELKEINKLELKPLHFSRDTINCLTKIDGRAYENGSCIIYPSRALYEKYPLDAKKAWREWAESRKPKYELSGRIDIYEDGAIADAIDLPELKFKSLEEAQQAAESVRKALANQFQHTPQ